MKKKLISFLLMLITGVLLLISLVGELFYLFRAEWLFVLLILPVVVVSGWRMSVHVERLIGQR